MQPKLQITPINALNDNYIWCVQDEYNCIVIDPGEAIPVQQALAERSITLAGILITHEHFDHVSGIADLRLAYPDCQVYGHAKIVGVNHSVTDNDTLQLGQWHINVWAIPGHTSRHLAYILHDGDHQKHVFCGDTLFSGGCGRVFDGTTQELQASLERLNRLPENTLLYPAHEYTKANLLFAQTVEPSNSHIQQTLDTLPTQHPTLPVRLSHERLINPFLRTAEPEVRQSVIRALSLSDTASDHEIFAGLREVKNHFRPH